MEEVENRNTSFYHGRIHRESASHFHLFPICFRPKYCLKFTEREENKTLYFNEKRRKNCYFGRSIE